MIIADDAAGADDIRRHLLGEIPTVRTEVAADGAAALRRIQSDLPDTVIVSARAPDVDVFSLCREVKKDPRTGPIPILVVFGEQQKSSERVRALESGADACLSRPLESEELLALVRVLLRRKESEGQSLQKYELLVAELARGTSELRASETRFRTLFEYFPDPTFVGDEQGFVLDVNEAACRLHNVERSELIGTNVVNLVPEPERDEVLEMAPKWVSGEVREREGHSLTSDGRRIPVEIKAAPIEYNGRPAALFSVRDVTARKKESARQFVSIRGLRAIVEIADELITCRDLDSLFRRAVELARSRLGLERVGILREAGGMVRGTFGTDMQGNTTDERGHFIPMDAIWRERFRLRGPHEHRWSFSTETLRDWRSGHMADSGSGWVAVTPIQTASKAIAVFCNDAAISGAPFDPDKQELVAVYCSLLANIIERKSAELENATLASALDQSTEGVFITDLKGVITYANPALSYISGYSIEELVGRSAECLGGATADPKQHRVIWDALRRNESWTGRITNVRKAGQEYQADMVVSPIKSPSGEAVSYLASCRDITHEIEMELALRQSQKMESIGRLTGGIAHDFNNLLTGILGFARLLKEQLGPDHECQPDVEEIIKSGERAARLTRQLLAFGHKQVIQVRTLNLNDVVTQIDQLLRRTLGERIELVTHVGSDELLIEADSGMIEQVIMNLAVNSRDAMPDGGTLIISTSRVVVSPEVAQTKRDASAGDFAVLSVRDTGVGMTNEVRSHVFEPFFTTKGRGSGTGLGLSTVYGVVKQARGFIELDSTAGVGTEFRIYFPAARKGAREAAPDVKAVPHAGHETILLVEDEPTVRRLAFRDLSQLGYRVLEAGHGDEALSIYEKERGAVDLVLTDVVMPIMGGVELVKRLRNRNPGIRVLYMSGFTEDLQLGGAAMILKPFTIEALTTEIRRVLDA